MVREITPADYDAALLRAPADCPLLAKYLFTSERLSIQVHPDDAQARTRGEGKLDHTLLLRALADRLRGSNGFGR